MQNNNVYIKDLDTCLSSTINLDSLKNKTILITGATGMIGSFMVDAIMRGNHTKELNCTIIAMGRNEAKAKVRFSLHWKNKLFQFVQHDVNFPLGENVPPVDYVIHSASTTHPVAYATEPISTITTNIFGTCNLLNYICTHSPKARFVLTSSVEIYGQNRGDTEYFDESYCGYIDCNTLRAGYPESKRLSEALCQAYVKEKGVDYVSARIPRTYGPTMLMSDTKALSQFIKKGLAGEDIVLKSKGEQFFSYAHVVDTASAILSIMLAGETGLAYNISDKESDITLREIAQIVADASGTQLCFELPDTVEAEGFSTATKAVQNSMRLRELGWLPHYTIKQGIANTLAILSRKHQTS